MRAALIACCMAGASSLAVHRLVAPAAMCSARERGHHVRMQLVHMPKSDDGGDGDDGADGGEAEDEKILRVSRIVDEKGQPLEETGRSVASMQFMVTRAMEAQLEELGYSKVEIDAMEPARAAAIIAKGTPSSKQPQIKPKSKRERFELQFTCNVCEAPNSHSISWHAYTKGTVLVTCPGCQATHLIADNLNWIEDDFRNLEDYMAKRGTPVTRVVTDGVAAEAAARAASAEGGIEPDEASDDDGSGESDPVVVDKRRPWAGTKPAVPPLEGITDEQARRIREAVRERKRRKRSGEIE